MNQEKSYHVYIMASRIGGTLYTGMTGDLASRTASHREGLVKGFTKKYGVVKLIYFENFSDPGSAIKREKQLKKWNRAWKIALIEKDNPDWLDLWPNLRTGNF